MKILLLAALLGFAASSSIAGWDYNYQVLNLKTLQLNANVIFDAGYGTHWGIYKRGQVWTGGIGGA